MVNGKSTRAAWPREGRHNFLFAISHFLFSIPNLPEEPGLALAVLRLERLDLVGVPQR